MSSIVNRVHGTARLVKAGNRRELAGLVGHRWRSELLSYGLRRDLTIPFAAPDANFPLSVRPLSDADIPKLLDLNAPDLTEEAREERTTRLQMLEAGIVTCYVAVTEADEPCYMQWLIASSENDKVQTYFKGLYPVLDPNEALLEGAFTPEAYRGQRIMPCAMAQLAEKGVELGARYVITFVTHDNIPSLKGCKRSGFYPYLTRKETWRNFHRQLSFTPLPEGTPYPFEA